MKNYYEILEVDSKASPEVIEKAYRTLVKKYHPDLQNGTLKSEHEEKMKEINEAYSVLTDDYKKTTYDEQLKRITISREEYEKAIYENKRLKDELEKKAVATNNQFYNKKVLNNNYQRSMQNNEYNGFQDGNTITNIGKIMQEEIKRAIKSAYNKAYEDIYAQNTKKRGHKIKYKHSFKYYIKLVCCTLVVILAGIIIYQIPIVKNFFSKLYENNMFFRLIINIFKAVINVFKSTFSTKPW